MGFTVEQDCPQCGAPIQLDETDHLLKCPFCDTKSFLFAPTYFRFILPNNAINKDIIYAPYLRFKGNVFFCQNQTVGHRIVDISHLGFPLKRLPVSLGLRPQAMKMKFVTPDINGGFLKFSLKASEILERASNLSQKASGKLYHRAFIGETLSLIYLPLFIEKERLFDAILNRPLCDMPQDSEEIEAKLSRNPQWKLTFLPTLCPRCGWNLEGENDSVVLTCSNCDTAWEAAEKGFSQLKVLKAPEIEKDSSYLPFWKITASAPEVQINTYADFMRITKQPRVIQKAWENQNMSFWIPAFKIRPKIFLQLSRLMTISQPNFMVEDQPFKSRTFPVTLPRIEAQQSLKISLAASAINKQAVWPSLPKTRFKIKNAELVYLPFSDTGHEMVQQHQRISINKNALKYGRRL